MINYNQRIFKSVSNSETGEVSAETRFKYQQQDNLVWAEDNGGEIIFGILITKVVENDGLEMRYQHLNSKGELMTGRCFSTPQRLPNGKIPLLEKWQWTSGYFSSGESVIE